MNGSPTMVLHLRLLVVRTAFWVMLPRNTVLPALNCSS